MGIKGACASVKTGNEKPIAFYSELWNKLAYLSLDEKNEVVRFLEGISKTETLNSTFYMCSCYNSDLQMGV